MYRKIQKNVPVVKDTISLRKYAIGDAVVGYRSPKAFVGILVDAYVTINGYYRNPAYVVECAIDGKRRVFQALCKKENMSRLPSYFEIKA